jgi:hypothetical protein
LPQRYEISELFTNIVILKKTVTMMKNKYAAPTVELFPMETEGAVMTPSIGSDASVGDYTEIPGFGTAASGRAGYGTGANYSASGSDIEDMINDILTY